eukprot:CAMPEP_0197835498 /NCGR_PEP_ID=MMETSP1437-20131217/25925_1 /TAXON_ID=49252 ORGANISM="Eucampia antarctica, Strain CCMP1452" /NCGR_SAMPLE_ID=MMETSP1437 /ASSEMBLY_ACC=CAM_ASM_001096 /LENGTH=900 /DNA_ID=CAMNT_0043440977 /DNA_START=128 /DNA_END=2833 /DNA_ORIENTATION=+
MTSSLLHQAAALVALSCLLTYSPCNSFGLLTTTKAVTPLFQPIFGVYASSSSSSSSCLSATLENSPARNTASSTSIPQSPSPTHKFDARTYDKPIVLVGCSGAGKELYKLAAGWISTKGGDGGRAVTTCGNDERGAWAIAADTIATRTTVQDVILLDFDASALQVEQGAHASKLTKKLTELLEELYQKDYLVVYVNVHPQHSNMNKDGNKRKQDLEQSVFIKNSHFEIVIKDEGLDTTTKMAEYLLQNQPDNNNNDYVDISNTEEILLQSLDPLTKLRSSEKQTDFLEEMSLQQGEGWDRIEWEFRRLLAHATSTSAIDREGGIVNSKNTFFLSLSFEDVTEAKPFMEKMCADVDSMEFRADLLKCTGRGEDNDRFELLYQQQLLRHMCRPYAIRAPALPEYQNSAVIANSMPIVYTVRTQHQAGTWPDETEEDIQQMFDLLYLGLRTGVEVLDVESAWDKTKTNELLIAARDNYAPTSILGSHHVVGKAITTKEAVDIYHRCTLDGQVQGAKVVLSMGKNDDGNEVKDTQALESAKLAELDVPYIALMLGPEGQYSRIINTGFTPVTHEALPFIAAPGQLSANEIMATRLIMQEIQPTRYGILGHKISYSVSPAMHNTAFSVTNLPHTYELVDMEKVSDIVESEDSLWNSPKFGGCSVTIPHKQDIIPYLDELTPAARDIGAVNTVIVKQQQSGETDKETRYLLGDNTDWKGIYRPLQRRLSTVPNNNYALILGGGGTARAAAYAANQLGLKCLYFNRTPQKAQDLQEAFGGIVVSSLADDIDDEQSLGSILKSSSDDQDISVIASTLPASVEFTLPQWIIRRSNKNKIVVLDVNYKPYWTALSQQLSTMQDKFDIVRGSEMLWEQGIGQFEAWTGRTAPYDIMKRVVLENCLPKDEEA